MSMNPTKLQKLKLFAENAPLAMHQEAVSINDTLQGIKDTLQTMAEKPMPEPMHMPEMPTEMKVKIDGAEVVTIKGEKGDKGDSPTDEEVLAIVNPVLEQSKQELGVTIETSLASLKALETKLTSALKTQQDGMNYIYDKVSSLKVETPDKEEIVQNVLAQIKLPEHKEETAIETRDKLESIKEEKEKLEIEAIRDLRKELDELKARPIGRGGGTSAIGVAQAFKYIAHTEEPVGAINGVNLTYTVKNDIFWIAGFVLNGEQIAQLPNFTYVGRTITFASALPSAYSGKDFEIKYIG